MLSRPCALHEKGNDDRHEREQHYSDVKIAERGERSELQRIGSRGRAGLPFAPGNQRVKLFLRHCHAGIRSGLT